MLSYKKIKIGGERIVYGVIDKESCRYYTYLKSVLDAIENGQVEYNWLITDTEIVAHSSRLEAINTSVHWERKDGKPIVIPAPDYYFLSGESMDLGCPFRI